MLRLTGMHALPTQLKSPISIVKTQHAASLPKAKRKRASMARSYCFGTKAKQLKRTAALLDVLIQCLLNRVFGNVPHDLFRDFAVFEDQQCRNSTVAVTHWC